MLQFLFSFHGRINRAKMWLFYLVGGAVWSLIVYAIFVLAQWAGISKPLSVPFPDQKQTLSHWIVLVSLLLAYATFLYCFLAVAAKRLHDRNRSAWWLIAANSIAAIYAVVPPLLDVDHGLYNLVMVVEMITLSAIAIWLILDLFVLPGTRGDNRFGPDPKPN